MKTSVLTLVRGRRDRLANLLAGLAGQMRCSDEIVIAYMQEEAFSGLPDPGCAIRSVFVDGDPMPLAAARNAAALAASGNALIFLDVDCIPGPGLVDAYASALEERPALYLGEVFYLPRMEIEGIDYDLFDRVGHAHPSKPSVPDCGILRESDVGQLWGLSFALSRQTFMEIGGMDPAFTGYGGEETDFALRLGRHGMPFYWVAGARAYHQHHPVYVPPLHQFEHILRNTALFHARHGHWCMDYWLGQFARLGLIEWTPHADTIRLLRAPTSSEIEAARQDGTVRYS